jgi:hypothetical protein
MGTGKRRINSAVRLEAKEEEVLAPELVQAVEQEHGQVAAEQEHGQVAAVLARDPVVELELDQVAAVPVPGHPRAHLVLPLGTKSVTAPHRPGLPLLAAEDLAAAAEIMPELAAPGAAVAWAVAVIAGAAVVLAEVVVVVSAAVGDAAAVDAAADAGDRRNSR